MPPGTGRAYHPTNDRPFPPFWSQRRVGEVSMAELKIAPVARADTGRNAPARNEACPLDLGWVRDVRVNLSAAERRVATLPGRRTVKKDAQAAWLLKAVTCIDLTTLSGDDTAGRVRRLCAKARSPIRHDILDALGMADRRITTGAICVYHRFVKA